MSLKCRVYIATSRDIGNKCIEWSSKNMPAGYCLVDSVESADIIISVLYDKILNPTQVKNKKCFNFHPGILPEYRGTGIFSWILINKEKKAGVTLHLIDKGIDTGDIIEIREFLISKDDTAYSLFLRSEQIIYKMFQDWFCDILNGKFTAVPQNLNDGFLYLRKDLQRAKNLTRFIRAFHFPDKESAYYFNDSGKKTYIRFKE